MSIESRPIGINDEEYPFRLRQRDSFRYDRYNYQVPAPPGVLHICGPGIDNSAAIMSAIGSRSIENNPSIAQITRDFLEEFFKVYSDTFKSPLGIASGMAIGGDYLAHDTALVQGVPTIAILPTEINNPKPQKTRDIYDRIIASPEPGNAVVSEYDPLQPGERNIQPQYYGTKQNYCRN